MPPERKSKARLVLDTNVFISGIISGKNPPGILFRGFQKKKYVLLVSDPITDEYLRILSYPKIRKYPAVSEAFIAHVCALLIKEAEHIETHTKISASPDSDDNKFLELAVDGGATMVVSGDKADLLSLKEINEIPIVTAAVAVAKLGL